MGRGHQKQASHVEQNNRLHSYNAPEMGYTDCHGNYYKPNESNGQQCNKGVNKCWSNKKPLQNFRIRLFFYKKRLTSVIQPTDT